MQLIDELRLELARLPAPTPNERTRRAIFFATALGFDCIELLSSFKTSNQKSNKQAETPQATIEFNAAVKELTGLSLYLTLLDLEEEDTGSWLVKFILDGLVASDKLNPLPAAQDILKHYEQFDNEKNACADGAIRVFAMMNYAQKNANAANLLEDSILRYADKRRSLLKTSLFEKFETLDENVQSRLAKQKGR